LSTAGSIWQWLFRKRISRLALEKQTTKNQGIRKQNRSVARRATKQIRIRQPIITAAGYTADINPDARRRKRDFIGASGRWMGHSPWIPSLNTRKPIVRPCIPLQPQTTNPKP
jgi:hypothetical protein